MRGLTHVLPGLPYSIDIILRYSCLLASSMSICQHHPVERIVVAAAQVLGDHGYDGASTNAIARRAGLSPGSLYQYFVDKDAIVAAVLERFVQDLLDTATGPGAPVYQSGDVHFSTVAGSIERSAEARPPRCPRYPQSPCLRRLSADSCKQGRS